MHGVTKAILVSCLSFFLAGCFLLPKKVEFGQKEIKAVPAKTEKHDELDRQAADYVDRKVDEAYIAAIHEDSSTNVTKPLGQAHVVSDALSTSLGPPKTPYNNNPTNLALSLDKGTATLNIKLEDYRDKMEPLIGKEIEGTGIIQMNYFVMIGGIVLLFWIGSILFKIASVAGWFHPAVGIGVNALKLPAKAIAKITSEVIEGGEEFKKRIEEEVTDEATVNKIKEIFARSHQIKQSRDTQNAVRDLTRK
jgi:hypothetical protein